MLEPLRKLLGADHVRADAPGKVAGVTPLGIAFPESTEALAAVVSWCASENVPIEPAGGCTWLACGKPPAQPPLVVSLRRLNAVTEYEPADLVVSAQAGITLQRLHDATAKHRQRLALDPPGHSETTLGALIANASAGPQRYAYGTPRDHVLGLQVVTGDGRIMNVGGKVVKNVAGYDLTRLLVGSRGTLGIITAAHVRLRPIPALNVTFEVQASPVELIELAHACRSAAFEPAALELIARDEPSSLLIRVHGNTEEIDAAAYELQAAGAIMMNRLEEKKAKETWDSIERAAVDATFSARLAALPTEAVRLLRLAERVRSCFSRALLVMHAGSGIARVYAQAAPVSLPALTEALQAARSELGAVRGSLIVPIAPAELHERFDCFPTPDGELRLMRELKQKFDPAGILSPGRFVV